MKTMPFKSILLFLISATLAIGAVTDVVIGQRAGANSRFVQRTITGSANIFKPIGFDATGTLSATAQLRGMSLRTPNGNSAIDITSDSTIKISINNVDSINAGTRKLINSSGVETVDWNTNTLSNNWTVTGNLRTGSQIVIGAPMAANIIDTSKTLNTKTLVDNATLTFSTTPTVGQVFGVEIKNTKASAITVTIPNSRDYNTGAIVGTLIVPATPGRKTIQWRYDGTDYIIDQGSDSNSILSSSTTTVTDRLVSFTDTTGKVIKDSGETVASLKSRANHTGQQAWNTINGLPTTLGGYGITDGQPLNTNLSNISLLADPNVDRLLFWDDSNGSWRHLTLGTNLSITDTTLNATATGSQAWSSITGTPTTLDGYGITNAVLTGITTNQGTLASTANPMTALAIDVSRELNTKTIAANSTFTFSGTPAVNQWFGVYILNSSNAAIVATIPTSIDSSTGATVTSVSIPASPGRIHLIWRYDGSYILYQSSSSGSSGSGSGFPLTATADFGGNNATNIGTTTSNFFIGDGSGITDLNASELLGIIPDITTETLTTSRSRVVTPTAGVGNVIVTDDGDTTIILDAATEILSYSVTPATGTRFDYSLKGHTVDCVVTIPPTYSHATGGLRTTYTVPANKIAHITVRYDGLRYIMWGDPTTIGDLPNATTPAGTAKIEIDRGGGSEYSTVDQLKTSIHTNPVVTGVLTNSGAYATTANAIGALAIDVTKELNTKTVTSNSIFTFTGTPVTNQWFGLYVKNTGAAEVTITFPTSKDSVSGATITTATIADTTGRQHLYWRWDGTEYIIYRGSSGGGGSGDAQLNGGNNWSGNQNVLGTVTATTFSGEGTLLDNIPGSAINGPIPDIEVDTLTTDNIRVITPTLVSGSVLDVTKGWLYKPLTADVSLTFSDTPATGAILWVEFICDSTARTITLPTAVYSDERGAQVTQFIAQANTRPLISLIKLADGWRAQGIPTQISNLTAVTSPDIVASIEIDQGTGSRRTTLANVKTALSLDTSRTGTHTLPSTTTPLSPTWTGPFHTVYYGATGTINLPAASAYADKGIIIYNTGNFTITVDASTTEVIVRDGVVQSGGVSFTLSSGAGNFVNLISDGTRWVTLGYKGTLTQGS